jgi:GNAT superfamily N-acetyltransferase
MQIRAAEKEDIPAIVELLKISLGESLMPKSETYWRWKHVDNPFGASDVLLAFEDKQLVGVRAFMLWSWQRGDERIRAVRAVDTATHPDFQGKGIFSKLTMALLKEYQSSDRSLVFNTPNDKSLPGYLKMGWELAGQLPIRIQIRRPVSVVMAMLKKGKDDGRDDNKAIGGPTGLAFLDHAGLPGLLERSRQFHAGSFHTPHTVDSLRWRYKEVPVAQYGAVAEEGQGLNGLFIYRLKHSRMGLELRVTDCFVDAVDVLPLMKRKLAERAREHGADYISETGVGNSFITTGLLSLKRNIGPMVTVRNISMKDMAAFKGLSHWHASVGDLELF